MNDTRRPGLLSRMAGGTWRAIDRTRQVVLNLLFLLVVLALLAIVLSPPARLADRTALVVAPKGDLVEQFTSDPTSRLLAGLIGQEAPEVQLRDLLRAIEAARDDKRIERLVLRTDRLTGLGLAGVRELAAALRDFRASGKEVIAYADSMEQRQYYLAAHADEVYLHPSGGIVLEGLSRYRAYYREALEDKLGLDVHLFRVGEYKSAAEPYIRDSASQEDREAALFWMGDLWQRMLEEIGEARGLDPARLAAAIDALPDELERAGGDLAGMALQQGLVDGLLTHDQMRALLSERGVFDEKEQSFRQVAFEEYLGHTRRDPGRVRAPKVAVIVAQGAILPGDQPPGTVGGDSTSKLLRDAREDERVHAVVLRVDSPGGAVFPSEQIRREVELTRAAGKPVVVSMANYAASGGYWISMDANEIYADPSTITGSIGIFGLWLAGPDALEKIGVRVDGVGTTRFAGTFDPTRSLDPEVGRAIQSIIDHGYRQFVSKVADARGRSEQDVDRVARGRVWSGAQAFERGLVDALGGLRDAAERAAGLADLEPGEFELVYIEKPLGWFARFLHDLGNSGSARALAGWSGLAPMLAGPQGDAIARDLAWLLTQRGQGLRPVAHCFCEL